MDSSWERPAGKQGREEREKKHEWEWEGGAFWRGEGQSDLGVGAWTVWEGQGGRVAGLGEAVRNGNSNSLEPTTQMPWRGHWHREKVERKGGVEGGRGEGGEEGGGEGGEGG